MKIKWILVHVDENRLKQHLQRFFGEEFSLNVDGGEGFIIRPSFINVSKNPNYGKYFPYTIVNFKYCSQIVAAINMLRMLTKIEEIPGFTDLWGIELIDSGIDRSIISYGYNGKLYEQKNPEPKAIISLLKEKIYKELSSLWKVEVIQAIDQIKDLASNPTESEKTSRQTNLANKKNVMLPATNTALLRWKAAYNKILAMDKDAKKAFKYGDSGSPYLKIDDYRDGLGSIFGKKVSGKTVERIKKAGKEGFLN